MPQIAIAIDAARRYIKRLTWRRTAMSITWLPADTEAIALQWSIDLIQKGRSLSAENYREFILSMISSGLLLDVNEDFADQRKIDDLIQLIERRILNADTTFNT